MPMQSHEYFALVITFVLLALELIVRTITLALPGPIIRFCYRTSRNAFNSLSSPHSRRSRNRKKSVSTSIAQASDFVELCERYGYYAEEHIVQTGDGYLLGLHRLGWRKGEEDQRVNAGLGSLQKKVVYLHHGLMMNSEVWVCITEEERCLPFMLVEKGYDVWLGNNRGNKYSKKSVHHSPTENGFWNFSMDQFAFHDIPDSIEYILETTGQPSLSYVGFSQGTAQAFATLSIHPTLNHKVDVFVALAPAMAPPGLASGLVSSFVKTNPEVLFRAFGRRAILGSATMWQALLYPGIFVYFIDLSLRFLFGWHGRNITAHQKLAAYPHLYSFTSTKSVVHWLQIIRTSTFQMYDDETAAPLSVSNSAKYYKVPKFPTRNIKTPIVLVYGGSDSLVDIKLMLKELPKHTVAKEIRKYEHLDFLWASDVNELVFPHVLDALELHAGGSKRKHVALGWASRQALQSPINGSQPPGYSEDEQRAMVTPSQAFDSGIERTNGHEQLDESESDSTPERFALTSTPTTIAQEHLRSPLSSARPVRSSMSSSSRTSRTVTSPKRMTFSLRPRAAAVAADCKAEERPGSPLTSVFSDKTEGSIRPEGWWSSDSAGCTASSSPSADKASLPSGLKGSAATDAELTDHETATQGFKRGHRRGSVDSHRSSDAHIDEQGITLSSKAAVVPSVLSKAVAGKLGGFLASGESSNGEGTTGGRRRARNK